MSRKLHCYLAEYVYDQEGMEMERSSTATSVLLTTVRETTATLTSQSSEAPTTTSSSSTTTTTTTTSTSTTTTTIMIRCEPTDWIPNFSTGFCYYAYQTQQSYGAAMMYCINAATDGDLVSIHSQEEQDFVYNNVILASGATMQNVWYMGLKGVDMIPYTTWLDGTPLDFTNWRTTTNEPDGSNTPNRCCIIVNNDGKWADTICSGSYASVCKAPGIPI